MTIREWMKSVLPSHRNYHKLQQQLVSNQQTSNLKRIITGLPLEVIMLICKHLAETDEFVSETCLRSLIPSNYETDITWITAIPYENKFDIQLLKQYPNGNNFEIVEDLITPLNFVDKYSHEQIGTLVFKEKLSTDTELRPVLDSLISRCRDLVLQLPGAHLQIFEHNWINKITSITVRLSEDSQIDDVLEHPRQIIGKGKVVDTDKYMENLKHVNVIVTKVPSDLYLVLSKLLVHFKPKSSFTISFIDEETYLMNLVSRFFALFTGQEPSFSSFLELLCTQATQMTLDKLARKFPNVTIKVRLTTQNLTKEDKSLRYLKDYLVSLSLTPLLEGFLDFRWLMDYPKLTRLEICYFSGFLKLEHNLGQLEVASKSLKYLKLTHMDFPLTPEVGLDLHGCVNLRGLFCEDCVLCGRFMKGIPSSLTFLKLEDCLTTGDYRMYKDNLGHVVIDDDNDSRYDEGGRGIKLPLDLTDLEIVQGDGTGKTYPFPLFENLNELKYLSTIRCIWPDTISLGRYDRRNYQKLKKLIKKAKRCGDSSGDIKIIKKRTDYWEMLNS